MSIAPIRTLKNANRFVPYEQNFSYTGSIVEWVVPSTGVYQIELWGGKGGYTNYVVGGKGSYVKSFHKLRKGAKYYLTVGNVGTGHNISGGIASGSLAGGYNGGGNGYWKVEGNYEYWCCAAGGGATSIQTENATLPNVSAVDEVLCVAAGGGGAALQAIPARDTVYKNGIETETSNGVIGQGSAYTITGLLAGGGGGLYGGNRAYSGTSKAETYRDHTYVLTVGNNDGAGKAKITRIE